ncbi:hypothetical protein L1987_43291 [Smallanthus sonchifolius]|uniref:Uncharacterized protein n=1 Tax=Smallanthus sonchifolius TaxID=185202 RepID=A0ACB9GN96_9ASTR|nr:hypothetical protein L1987_43291 [Smallanthus sonchifolius]
MGLFCLQKEIHHEFSAPYVPQQNGVAERKNRTLVETACTMLADSKLPVTFWAEAVNTASESGIFTNFGNPCTLLKVRDVPTKFGAKAIKGIFLGYVANCTTKRVYNKETRQVEEWFHIDCSNRSLPQMAIGPDWAFDYENLFKSFHLPSDISPEEAAVLYDSCQDAQHSGFLPNAAPNSSVPSTSAPDPNVASCSGPQESERSGEIPTNLDSEIPVKQDLSYQSDTTQVDVLPVPEVEPKNVEMALNDNNWIEAMQEELAQFDKLKVWNLVDLPKGMYPIGTKWVFKCKKDDRGVVVRNKARLVVQGFNQQEGIDYNEVYAPVVRLEAIRLFLAFASYKGCKVFQLDVYGKVKEEVYVCQPSGFEDPLNPNKVFKLDKALYGLCKDFESVMKSKFEMSAMGELSFFLGLQVNQKEDGFFIHQSKYVKDILSRFKMEDCTLYDTPTPVNHRLNSDPDGKDVDCRLYRAMIGSLMYLTTSRPDITFVVCICSRFQAKPKESHLIAVKRIFCYLKGKQRLGLWKSTTGGCQFLGNRLVSWQCKKQTTVFISTCEAEYIAAASCCSQILWIQQQLRDYGLNFTGTPMFIDNNATMSITNNPVKHSKTKHIEIRYHFIRDCVDKKLIELVKVHTDDNFADLFTKAFDGTRFEFLIKMIGMINPE